MVWRRRNVTACLIADYMLSAGVETVTHEEIRTALKHVGSTGDTCIRSYGDKLKAMGLVDQENHLVKIPHTHIHIVLPTCFSKDVTAKVEEITRDFEELRKIFTEA